MVPDTKHHSLRSFGLAAYFLRALHRRNLVTWERIDPDAYVLIVTNAWPHPERPVLGTFVERTVNGLETGGVCSDVLFVRGYRGWHAYLLGCVAMAVLSLVARQKYRLVHSHGGETALIARCYLRKPVLASYWGSDILGPQTGNLRERIKCFMSSRVLRAHSLLMTATTTKSKEMARHHVRAALADLV